MPLSPKQKALRRAGIGSSDVAAILGMSRFQTDFDVYLSKVEGFEPEPLPWQEMGELLEPVAIELYRRKTGASVTLPGTVRHPSRPILLDTADAVAHLPDGTKRPLEAKAIGFLGPEWGDDGTDDVEPAYILQCQHHMLVLREHLREPIAAVDMPVLFAGREHRIYRVPWDAELAEGVAEQCERWWVDHVVAGKPPPLEGSRHAAAWLARRFPLNRRPLEEATEADEPLAEQLRLARARQAEAKREVEAAKNRFRERIADADGVAATDGRWRVTWKANKNGVRSLRPWFEDEEAQEEAA